MKYTLDCSSRHITIDDTHTHVPSVRNKYMCQYAIMQIKYAAGQRKYSSLAARIALYPSELVAVPSDESGRERKWRNQTLWGGGVPLIIIPYSER